MKPIEIRRTRLQQDNCILYQVLCYNGPKSYHPHALGQSSPCFMHARDARVGQHYSKTHVQR